MRPSSNYPARLFCTAKTHKFNCFEDININDLKLRPIIDQTGYHTYDASKIVSKYLTPLGNNDYVISNTLTFPSLIRNIPLGEDEVDIGRRRSRRFIRRRIIIYEYSPC